MRRADITVTMALLKRESAVFTLMPTDVDYFKGKFPKYKFNHIFGAYYLVSNYNEDENS